MLTTIADQLQLQDGSCLLTSGQTTAASTALTSSPTTTALVPTAKTTALVPTAINKTALITGTAAGSGAGVGLGFGTLAGAILGVLAIGLVAFGVNKAVKVYIG